MSVFQLKLKIASYPLATNARRYGRFGYGSKKNGELLALAEGKWDVLLTSDKNVKYQQNMTWRKISILIRCAKSNRLKDLLPLIPACAKALLSIQGGLVVEISSA
jgi:hypothetical protein